MQITRSCCQRIGVWEILNRHEIYPTQMILPGDKMKTSGVLQFESSKKSRRSNPAGVTKLTPISAMTYSLIDAKRDSGRSILISRSF